MKAIQFQYANLQKSIKQLLWGLKVRQSFFCLYSRLCNQFHIITSLLIQNLNAQVQIKQQYDKVVQCLKKSFVIYQSLDLKQSQKYLEEDDQINNFINNRQTFMNPTERDEIEKYIYAAQKKQADLKQMLSNTTRLSFQETKKEQSKNSKKQKIMVHQQSQTLIQLINMQQILQIIDNQRLINQDYLLNKKIIKNIKEQLLKKQNFQDKKSIEQQTNFQVNINKKQLKEVSFENIKNKNVNNVKLRQNNKIIEINKDLRNKNLKQLKQLDLSKNKQNNNIYLKKQINLNQNSLKYQSFANHQNSPSNMNNQDSFMKKLPQKQNNNNYQQADKTNNLHQYLQESQKQHNILVQRMANEQKQNQNYENVGQNLESLIYLNSEDIQFNLRLNKQQKQLQQEFDSVKKENYFLSQTNRQNQKLSSTDNYIKAKQQEKDGKRRQKQHQIKIIKQQQENQNPRKTQNQENQSNIQQLKHKQMQYKPKIKQNYCQNSNIINNQKQQKFIFPSIHLALPNDHLKNNYQISKFMKKQSNHLSQNKKKDYTKTKINHSNGSMPIYLQQAEQKLNNQLNQFVKSKNQSKIQMYIGLIQTLHLKECGQNCRHLQRFFENLNKRNITYRKEVTMHKYNIDLNLQC